MLRLGATTWANDNFQFMYCRHIIKQWASPLYNNVRAHLHVEK